MRAVVRAADASVAAGQGLAVVSAGEVAAVATLRDGAPAISESELREHERIARDVHERVASLPARFGTLFADEDSLARALRERDDTLCSSLERVGTRVELAVTLSWRAPREGRSADAVTGTEFMRALAAREAQRDEAGRIVARLSEELASERAVIRERICPREGVAAIVAVLIQRDEVENMRRMLISFAGRTAEVAVAVHGPLPPYTFAS